MTPQPIWIKDCEICNAGACARVDELKERGYKIRGACHLMEKECGGVFTASQIRDRYRYHKGLHGGNSPSSPSFTQSDETHETCAESDLRNLIEAGKLFGTIYADPPWQYQNQATRSSTSGVYKPGEWGMTIDELRNLPIPDLVSEKAHLHLWTTNAFLFETPKILEAWGFEYKGVFLWVKPQIGIGNYWRVSHEFLILGVRGGLRFNDKSQRSWVETPRRQHSAKPGEVADIIERVSPGPYLELFGRRTRPGWTVWGNEIERTLFNESAFKRI